MRKFLNLFEKLWLLMWSAYTTRKTSYCSGFSVVVSKTIAIRHILRHFFELLLYVKYIVAYHQIAVVDIVFCGALQRQYKKLPRYMCFSGISFSYSGGIPNYHNICLFVTAAIYLLITQTHFCPIFSLCLVFPFPRLYLSLQHQTFSFLICLSPSPKKKINK